MMLKHLRPGTWLSLLCACLLLTACEKVVFPTDGEETSTEENTEEGKTTIRLHIAATESLEGTEGTRSLTNVADVCSRLNFLLYQNGKKVKTVNQKAGDASFGTVEATVGNGSYQLLVLAHSCAANPSSATLEKVQFNNTETGYSDTFYYYGNIELNGESQDMELTLKRAVAMFRLVAEDSKPSAVSWVKIAYTGGSGALNAITGFGVVKSQQYMEFYVGDAGNSPLQFDIFTFLHNETGQLNVTMTAMDDYDEVLYVRTFSNVSMKRNTITRYTGRLFVNNADDPPVVPVDPSTSDDPDDDPTPVDSDARGIQIKVDPEWDSINDFKF